jgi:two-component system nitrogen regulation sensor histidine kinase NtrY
MPEPVMEEEDLRKLVDQAVFLQETAHTDIAFVREMPQGPVRLACDSRQVGRALTNLLQNAAEAIHARGGDPATLAPGEVRVRLQAEPGAWVVELLDNGRGLPKEERGRLTEPYVTTRERGTGLGLAIVKKIVDEHGGTVDVHSSSRGSTFELRLPLEPRDPKADSRRPAKPRQGDGRSERPRRSPGPPPSEDSPQNGS